MKRSVVLGAVLLLAGCGVQPLSLWRVSMLESEKPASCFKDGIKQRIETAVQKDLGVWELYEGPGDKFYLAGVGLPAACGGTREAPTTVEGISTDGKYVFDVSDVCYKQNTASNPTETKVTSLRTVITLTPDGETFVGTWKADSQYWCVGSECSPKYTEENPNCVVEHQLKGAQVEAQNYHPL